jgi:endonuclease/exonuclease/phosphatase family metal-dependent hydrolase
MQSVRSYRLIEASLTLLCLLQAGRAVLGGLHAFLGRALQTGQVDPAMVNGHLLLIVAMAAAWFAPRPRATLPTTLGLSAIAVAVVRVVMTVEEPLVRHYAALGVLAAGSIYLTSLVRANYRTMLSAWVVALTLDQLLRVAGNTYDPTLRQMWLVPQIFLSGLIVLVSRVTRAQTGREPYLPGNVNLWGGLGLGGLLALEVGVLGLPNVIARWTGAPYEGLVPWLLLATALPLSAGVRHVAAQALGMFEERARGWIWLLLLELLLVIGNRLGGLGAAGALIVGQFLVVMALWWVPVRPDPSEVEQVGPMLSVGLGAFVGLLYVYGLTFEYADTLMVMRGQALTVLLVASALAGGPMLLWREEDPWLAPSAAPGGLAWGFIVVVVVAGLILGEQGNGMSSSPATDRLRVASYNINGGYGPDWRYNLEWVAETIQVSEPDIVILQEVDAGRPASYGVDQALWLARRLGFGQVFQPTIEHVAGIAILSRWPIVDSDGVLLASQGEQMAVAHAEVMVTDGRAVHVYGTRLGRTEEERDRQWGGVVGFVAERSPALIGIDLGTTPEDEVYQQVTAAGFTDPHAELGIVEANSFPSQLPVRRVDYVLVRNLKPLALQMVDSTASDHRLVVVEVAWP